MMRDKLSKGVVSLLSTVAICLVLVLSPVSENQFSAKGPLRIGDAPPRVSMSDLGGNNIRIPDDHRGKVLVLHFWTSGCSSCREEMPALDSLLVKYHKRGLVVLAVNVGQRKDAVKKYMQGLRVSYPVLLDPDRNSAAEYEVVAVPRTFIIDRNGIIRFKILGGANGETLQKYISSLL